MRATIFGIGYVGLVQAAVLAEVGHDILCIDVDERKIDRLRQGDIPIFEPGLEEMVARNLKAGRLQFATEASEGIAHASLQFIAVGTPPSPDGGADLRFVEAVAKSIGALTTSSQTVVVKSTVPVGTSDIVRRVIAEQLAMRGVALECEVVSNPEFLKEGAAIADCMRPDRIVIGTRSSEALRLMREVYEPFNRNHEKFVVMDQRSAELTKYAANCMLATKISFMNEIATIADRVGADVEMVRHGIGSDPRIGYDFIYPGVGYGGSCFPKDVRALIHSAEALGVSPALLKAVEERNESQKSLLLGKIDEFFEGNVTGKTFAFWGLAFKPNTDDMREAPSRAMIEGLLARGARVRAYDPAAMGECRSIYGDRDDLTYCESQYDALEGADALVVVTEWKAFQAPDFAKISRTLRHPAIFDGRNLYNPETVERAGIAYFGIGRGSAAKRRPDTVEPTRA